MSDLGSEELEEEGENDIGVRASGEGGASAVRGGERTPAAGFREWGGLEASHSPLRQTGQGLGSSRPQRALPPGSWC